MAGEIRGSKLHSIIEKLSEQCGRGSSPSHDEESEDSGSQIPSDLTDAFSKRKNQRKGTVKRLKKDTVCGIVDSEEEEVNSDGSSLYTVEIPAYNSTDTWYSTDDNGSEQVSENREKKETKRRVYPKKQKAKRLPKRVLKQRRYAVLAAWKKKNAEERKARQPCKAALMEKVGSGESHDTENDLCIDVASFVKLGAQMKDIDPVINLEQCFACNNGPFKEKVSLTSHIKEHHPDLCLVKRKKKRQETSDFNECKEVVKKHVAKRDENLPKGSIVKEGRRTSLRVQHLERKPLYEELSAFKQMVSNNIQIIRQENQNKIQKRWPHSNTVENKTVEVENTDKEFVNAEAVDDDLCISVQGVLAMPAQVKDIDDDPAWVPQSDQESQESSSSEEPESEPEPVKQTYYKCHKCGETSVKKEWKKQHLKDNPECRPEFKCDVCGKVLHYASSHLKHLATHSNDRPYKCDVCESTFKDKSYLKKHMITHTGHKRFNCDKCDKRFAHRGSLKQHLNRHAGFKPFKCSSCNEAFYTRSGLTSHEMQHSGETPFTCDKCGKGFAKSYGLKMHMTSHSDVKPFKCEVCGKAFKRKDHLREHCIIHSDVKPHKCDTCGRTFNQHVCLRKHLPCREAERQEKREQKRKEKEMIEEEKKGRRTESAKVTGIETRKNITHKNLPDRKKRKSVKVDQKNKVSDKKVKGKPKSKKQKQNEGVETGGKSLSRGSSSSEARNVRVKPSYRKDSAVPSTSCVSSSSSLLNTPNDIIWSAAQSVCHETTVSSVSGVQQSSNNDVRSHSSPVVSDFQISSTVHLEDSSSLNACTPILSPSQLSTNGEHNSPEQQPFVPFAAGGTGLNFFSHEALDQLVDDTESSAHALGSPPLPHEPTTELGQVLMSTLDADDNFLM